MDDGSIAYDEAVKLLPAGKTIHTYRNPGAGMLIGADVSRDRILSLMKENGVKLSGESATRMKHGLVVDDNGFLFIETVSKDDNAEEK